jgi:threonine synthase
MIGRAEAAAIERRADYHTVCTGCGNDLGGGFVPFCSACDEMSDVAYDLRAVEIRDSENPYLRFLDLLPVADASLLPADARFTPCVHATQIGAANEVPFLYLKDETGLPTGTTKDRMAAVALPYLYESGVRSFATSSTGNSSSAYARALARVPEITMYVFTASSFRNRLSLDGGERVVDVVLEDATFVEAFNAAGEFARGHAVVAERGFFNPGRREGLKVAWLEAVEQVPRHIDWYVQAVSSAMGVYGVYKAARELEALGVGGRPPRLLCVQQETCAPMVSAWRDGSDRIRPEDVVDQPHGIAHAILRGDPTRAYPHVRRIVEESGGTLAAVSEREIRDAHRALHELEGVPSCFAGAAALAGLFQMQRAGVISADDAVLVNVTGSDRPGTPPTAATHRLRRGPEGWDFDSLGPPPG